MKYKIIASYIHTDEVDTESSSFKEFEKSNRRWYPGLSEEKMAIKYAERAFGWDIIDDEGHGTVTPSSFEWKATKIPV